ncbi:MAG: S9 family peptidase [Haliea sp.]
MNFSLNRRLFKQIISSLFLVGFLANTSFAGFSTNDMHELKTSSTALISPDGNKLAYVVTEADTNSNRFFSKLWVTDWSGNGERLLAEGAQFLLPQWSPDGKKIAFVGDDDGQLKIQVLSVESGRIHVIDISPQVHGDIAVHPFFSSLQWSPDGRKIAYTAHDAEAPEDPYVWKRWYSDEGFGDTRNRIQIWAIEVETEAILQLTDGDFHHGQPVWSPDGASIAFVSNRLGQEGSSLWSINENYDIWTVPSRGGSVTQVTKNTGPDSRPVWSPDGTAVAYISVPYQGSHADVAHLVVTDLSSKETRALTSADTFDYFINLGPGAWVGNRIFFTADIGTTSQAFSTNAEAQGEAPRVLVSGQNTVSSITVSDDGSRMAYILQSPNSPTEVWRSRTNGRQNSQVTRLNPQLQSAELASSEVVQWKGHDGLALEGILVKPAKYDEKKKYPLAVLPHGGPHSASKLQFNVRNQVYASAGFIVFEPNVRGSTGYGQPFINANRGNLGGGDFQDLMSGVDFLIGQGIADPDRLVMEGWSYGGYMTTWTVGNSQRFKAAVAGAPVVNAQSFFATTDIPQWVVWEYLGLPWERPDLIRANSPITYVHHVTTPTMVMHGENDVRVPLSQGLEFYNSLQAIGVPTKMVIYPGERHGLSRPLHQAHRLDTTVSWFLSYVDPN